MNSYFNTTEINSALSNISNKLSEKANVANLYPVLKKATSSSEEATPGYVFQVFYTLQTGQEIYRMSAGSDRVQLRER